MPVLRDVDLTIQPGQRIALVGATGAGKSTIARLIMRFYDPTAGRVSLDGCYLRTLSFADLRHAITMVPQEGFLFSGTILENILFGKPDASPEDVRRARISLTAAYSTARSSTVPRSQVATGRPGSALRLAGDEALLRMAVISSRHDSPLPVSSRMRAYSSPGMPGRALL